MRMVTEMTGGYQLLVPPVLAVILSYLVEATLSPRFKYSSLYVAPVPAPAYSPAHHAEHLQTAFRLIRERRAAALKQVGHLDLRTLLESGLPVELPDGKQLGVATLAATSPAVGQPITVHALDEMATAVEPNPAFRHGYTHLHCTGARARRRDTTPSPHRRRGRHGVGPQ